MLVGTLFPQGGAAIRQAGWGIPLMVAAVLLISGYTLELGHAVRQATNARALFLGLATTYVVAPIIAYPLARLYGPPVGDAESTGFHFLQAVMIMAAQAGPVATAIAMTTMARGDHALALVLTLISNTITAFLTPIILRAAIGSVVAFPLAEMMARLALVIILPVILGIALRQLAGPKTLPTRLLIAAKLIPQWIVLTFVYIGFASASEYLGQEISLAFRFAAVCISLNGLLLIWSALAAGWMGLSPASRIAITFCGSQKTVPNGFYLWETFFSTNPYGAIPMVFYQITQLAGGALLAPWIKLDDDSNPE
jgi:BASS family bile acid:Na+ symporter